MHGSIAPRKANLFFLLFRQIATLVDTVTSGKPWTKWDRAQGRRGEACILSHSDVKLQAA